MLLTKEVEINLKGSKPKHYESLGYEIPKKIGAKGKEVCDYSKSILVKIEDLPHSSEVIIKLQCDYCGKEIEKLYKDYYKQTLSDDSSPNKKDCCYECRYLKKKESDMIIHGVAHTTQLKSTQDKMKKSMMNKLGVEYASQSQEVKDKIKSTNLERYGFEVSSKSEIVKDKFKNTCLDRYGVDHPVKLKSIQQKIIDTYNFKYGCHPMQVEEIKNKAIIKQRIAFYNNETAPCSRQQKYISLLFRGKLNYPVNKCSLDIAFPEEMIYVEYFGGGHYLDVKLGEISLNDKQKNDRRRWYALKSKGWKEIRILSIKDYLPQDNIILDLLLYAKDYLSTGHSWIKFDIDNSKIITSQYEINVDYGILRKIKQADLEEVS